MGGFGPGILRPWFAGVLCWVAGLSVVTANPPDPIRFQQILLEDGLSQITVNSVIQDRDGFLWVGTQDGLNRYDGYHFVAFGGENDPRGELSSKNINQLLLAPDGAIWIATRIGLNRFDAARESITSYLPEPDNQTSLSHEHVTALAVGGDGTIWVGTVKGLNSLDPRTGQFTRYLHDPSDEQSLATDFITSLAVNKQGGVWIGTDGGGLYLLEPATQTLTRRLGQADMDSVHPFRNVSALLVDHEDQVWVAAGEGILLKGDGTPDGWKQPIQHAASPPSDVIETLFQDHHDHLWIGARDGLFRLDPAQGTVEHFFQVAGDRTTLTNNVVQTIFEDETGVMWIGTFEGLNKYVRNDERFKVRGDRQGERKSLPNSSVRCLYETRDGLLWVGTLKGAQAFDRENRQVFNYTYDPGDPRSLSHERVFSFFQDPRDRFWVGTYNGLCRLEDDGGFTRFSFSRGTQEARDRNNIRIVVSGPSGFLWVGTRSGLVRFDPETGDYKVFESDPSDADSLSGDAIQGLLIDRNNRMWVGTKGSGLNRFDMESGRSVRFRHNPEDPNSLAHDHIHTVMQSEQGSLWIGSNGGLSRFDPLTAQFTNYSEKDGLCNNTVYGILEDEHGYLWLSTNNGLSRFDPEQNQFRNFYKEHGLQSNEFNVGSFHKSGRGEFFFGGINGYNHFFPGELQDDPREPAVVLTRFTIFNKPITMFDQQGREAPAVSRPLHQVRQIGLSYKDYVFAFEFAALHFAAPQLNQYQYKLVGLDPDWVTTGADRRFAVYTNLPPGGYTFRVRAANHDGVWNEDGIAVQINIAPPWWRTKAAYALYVLALVALVSWYLRSQKEKLQRERDIVNHLKRVDRMKDEFLANTSHELRTPLNGIIGLTESLIDGAAGKVNERIVLNLRMVISSARRLSALVNDILDFSQLKNQDLKLTPKPVDLRPITDMIFALNQPLLGEKQIRLINDIPTDAPLVMADENRTEQILHTLIGNAVKFTESGEVVVTTAANDSQVTVKIRDTGIGIAEEKQERIFNSFEQADGSESRVYGGTGLGLAISKYLVALHGGRIWVNSEEGKGSTFSFTLPRADRENQSFEEPDKAVVTPVHRHFKDMVVSTCEDSPAVQSALSQFRILVVDDEPINRGVILNCLAPRGYHIREASGGKEALDLVREESFDLVLLDLMMPRVSGLEVCKVLREQFSVHELPIIVLTARNQLNDLVTCFAAGANDYLTKPISREELISRVQTHLQLLDINRNLERKVFERTQELEAKNQELETMNQELQALDDIVKAINREITLQRVLDTILSEALRLFPRATKGAFVLRDDLSNGFRLAAAQGYDIGALEGLIFTYDSLVNRYTKSGENLEEGVFLLREPEPNPQLEGYGLETPKCLLAMSLDVSGQIQGFLILENFTDTKVFDHSDAARLQRFREHAVSALAKAHFLQELREKNEEILHKQTQLLDQQKMVSLGTLTAGVAHEIRNPLNFVNNFSGIAVELVQELMEYLNQIKDTMAPEAYTAVMEMLQDLQVNATRIHEHGERANHIVHGMMEMAGTGGVTTRQTTDLNRMVDELTQLAYRGIQARAPQVNIHITKKCDPALKPLEKLSANFGRAFVNIVTNAMEAAIAREQALQDQAPSVEITTSRGERHTTINIRDNGPGIAAEDQEQIFTPFFTAKPVGSGHVGLGLSAAYDIIVQENRGELRFETSPQGTSFTISLPN